MRELTFRGFLTEYIRSLSLSDTTNMQKLMQEAVNDNPRLREPLLLYALFSDKASLFIDAAARFGLDPQYALVISRHSRESMELELATGTTLPAEYGKVWTSYQARKNRLAADNHTKELIRLSVRKLQSQHGITNYRLYTELGLNPGNLNAWLKHGNGNKVSLATARSVLQFAKKHSAT